MCTYLYEEYAWTQSDIICEMCSKYSLHIEYDVSAILILNN